MADLMDLVVSFISRLKDVSQAGFKLEKEFACYKNILKIIDNEKLKPGHLYSFQASSVNFHYNLLKTQ